MDPRVNIVNKRFEAIKRVIAVSGGKGGIGKSLVASGLALILARQGYKVGLLDLDLWGPTDHLIIGAERITPKEEKGIIPPEVCRIKFMSIIYYGGDKPLPLRRIDFNQATIELLAVTRWEELDFLIIDMPPGIGDPTLDVIRLINKAKFLIVTTKSRVVLETVKKTLRILNELNIPVIGVIENMKMGESVLAEEIKKYALPFLGSIDFDKELEDSIGNPARFLKTDFAGSIREIISKLWGDNA